MSRNAETVGTGGERMKLWKNRSIEFSWGPCLFGIEINHNFPEHRTVSYWRIGWYDFCLRPEGGPIRFVCEQSYEEY